MIRINLYIHEEDNPEIYAVLKNMIPRRRAGYLRCILREKSGITSRRQEQPERTTKPSNIALTLAESLIS